MRKFASLFAIVFSCACLSAFADESNESVNSAEVTVSDDSGSEAGDVAPQCDETVKN